jgi:amino acid transporter
MKKIAPFALSLLIVSAIDSIRNLPSSAIFGSSLILSSLFAALLFLLPTALVSAELSASNPTKGGIYHWVAAAFGEKIGMLAIWLQWINTMVWFPSFLAFVAGTAAYPFAPELASNKFYLIASILLIFWTMTFLSLRGLHFSAKLTSFFSAIGTVAPLLFLIGIGFYWYFSPHPHQIEIKLALPQSDTWTSLIAIMASYLGMELAGVHVSDIDNPQKNFPKTVLLSALFIFLTMLFGSLAIALILPADQINLVAGIGQVFETFLASIGLAASLPFFLTLIVIGSIGGMVNWLISPAKGLLHASEFGFLPPYFTKTNSRGVASRILIAQALLISLFSIAYLLIPSVSGVYWFLTALSTELYLLMYLLMFASAFKLRRSASSPFKIPGGRAGLLVTICLGSVGCLLPLAVGFFPPPHIDVGSPTSYALMIGLGNLAMIAPVFLFYLYKKRRSSY